MKRFIAVLLTAVLCLSLVGHAQEEAPFTGYYSDFTMGLDGWYPRSADNTVELKRLGYVIEVRGRTASWNSPGRDFPLLAGVKYRFSVDVKQTAVESAEFMVSVAHTRDGAESYENLGRVTAKQGPWVTISGEYTPEAYDKYTLYVETVGNGDINFMMRDFTVEPVELHFDGDLPSLKEVYADYFDVGSCVNGMQMRDKAQIDFFATQYNIFTHENELKPDSVLDVTASKKLAKEDETAVAVKFTSAKPMLDYCQKNGIKVHGHVLVWHSQTPEAFFHEGYDTAKPYVTREVMLARMENYIRQVLQETEKQWPGVIVSWDVVNEAVADGTGALRESNWTKVVGQDFVNRAFEYARKYAAPGVLLCYNDYNTPNEPKLTGICNLLDSLMADGTIDGYGFQGHYKVNDPHISRVKNAMERIAAKGLKLRVSELDVGISENTRQYHRQQADYYKELFLLFLEYADQMEAVQVWGLTDDRSWRSESFPLLFDKNMEAKLAFYSVAEAVKEETK
ncbi:MAG: endo-1,4-beta-xylanase [Clostridia bacterium]|nr:endo-1,4-beta-xylanase [Clostridia bacterium]